MFPECAVGAPEFLEPVESYFGSKGWQTSLDDHGDAALILTASTGDGIG